MRTSLAAIGLAAIGVAAATLSGGCLQQLDRKDAIKDLRILAIKTEPAELVDDPLPAQVHFEALVVDPKLDDPFDVPIDWQFCPVESEDFCHDYDAKVAAGSDGAFSLDDLGGLPPGVIPGYDDCAPSNETIAGLALTATTLGDVADPTYLDRYRTIGRDATYDLAVGGNTLRPIDLSFLTSLSQDLIACGEPAPNFPLPGETSDLHLYHFVTNPLESLLGAWPSMVITARGHDGPLTAQKRLPLIFRHPYNPLFLLRTFVPGLDLGVNVCPPGHPAADCLDVASHPANRNPEITGIRLRDGHLAGDDTPFTDFWTVADGPDPRDVPPRRVGPKGTLRIDPIFSDDSQEEYERFTVDPNSLEVSVLQDKEDLSVSWFTTGGGFRDEITWEVGTKGLDNGFEARVEPGIVYVFMVARDQRGGTDWKGFRIEVEE